MKKIFFKLCLIFSFFLFVGFQNNCYGYEYSFSTINNVVEKINRFRSLPLEFISNMDLNQEEINKIINSIGDNGITFLSSLTLPYLKYDNCLSNIAYKHLNNILTSGNIANLEGVFVSDCGGMFNGESLVGLAFQNYIDAEQFQDYISDYLIKSSLYMEEEGVPILFPYNKIGGAILNVKINLNGIDYNFYLIDIIYSVDIVDNGIVYGKINNFSEKGRALISIYNDNDTLVDSFYTMPDKSFYIKQMFNPGIYRFDIKYEDNNTEDVYLNYNSGRVIILQ